MYAATIALGVFWQRRALASFIPIHDMDQSHSHRLFKWRSRLEAVWRGLSKSTRWSIMLPFLFSITVNILIRCTTPSHGFFNTRSSSSLLSATAQRSAFARYCNENR